MENENQKRTRVPFNSVGFTDARDGASGFAKDWYFWVSDAFKPALDIGYNEYIHDKKTRALRDRRSYELFGVSHADLKKRIEAAGERLADSDDHKRIMGFAVRYPIETQGAPPLYSFRQTDGLESRNGEWYVQVQQSVADTEEVPGRVDFQVLARIREPENGEGAWRATRWLTTSQRDFVELLRTGRCSVVDLVTAQLDAKVEAGSSLGGDLDLFADDAPIV
jgi:hypothetical protein